MALKHSAVDLSAQVERVYSEIDQAVQQYAMASGLGCPELCGACCRSPQIEVTVLDALPMALDLAAAGAHEAEFLWEQLRWQEEPGCPVFVDMGDGRGRCGRYEKRPSLCRLYGFAGATDKHGAATVALCRVNRERGVEVEPKIKPPLFGDYSRRLQAVNPGLGTTHLPIHEAIGRALEKVLLVQELVGESRVDVAPDSGAPEDGLAA